MQSLSFRIVMPIAIGFLGVVPGVLFAQESATWAERSDLAALVVMREVDAGGHRARLATHRMQAAVGTAGAQVSATLFLPEGGAPARNGMIAFLVDDARGSVHGGAIGFRWHFAGMDTVVVFPARVQSGLAAVSYAAELTEQDLLFLATAHALEVELPDGRVLVVDADLRRRLGLLARLSGLTVAQRDELATFSRAIESSIRGKSHR